MKNLSENAELKLTKLVSKEQESDDYVVSVTRTCYKLLVPSQKN